MDFDAQMENDNVPSSGEEDNIDDRKHNQLLDAISSLDGKKRSKLSQRTVISNQISEFNFTSSKDDSSRIKLHELVGSLKESMSHGDLKKQLRDIEKNKETVTTPLPKHEKEKLDRSTAYESAAQEISKWDPIVKKNRKAEQLEFPLQKQDFRIVTTDQFVKRFQPRTPLEQEVAALLRGSDNVIHDKHQELTAAEQRALKAMDLDEAKQRRMELMKHRALLSYKEAKAKRQKKIKSKKYHRILKKEKRKSEGKMMDKMKDDDPEGFLDKLNQLEKDRAEERMSLKHRGASKFAKRQTMYAKYDDRARQEVQDMLQKSRELTKKVDVESDSDNEEMFPDTGVADDVEETEYTLLKTYNNPWMAKPSRQLAGVNSSKEGGEVNADSDEENDMSNYSRPEELRNEENVERDSESDDEAENGKDNDDKNGSVKAGNDLNLRNKKKMEVHDLSSLTEDSIDDKNKKPEVNILSISDVIEDIFQTKLHEKAKSKRSMQDKKKSKIRHRKLNKERKAEQKNKSQTKLESGSDSEDGSDEESNVKTTAKKGNVAEEEMVEDSDYDETNNESLTRKQTLEELEENSDNNDDSENAVVVKRQKLNANAKKANKKKRKMTDKEERTTNEKEAFVDPKKLFTLETKLRQTGSGPAIVDNDDEEEYMDENEQQRMTIAQAFADDDVIEEFTKEKGEVIERGKPKDIDLTLPGWGSWGGEGVRVSRRKRKRFTVKAPPALPRKDEHLGHVIINESKINAVTKHQVHEIPYPYVNAQQFETSIRAPLGKTWNPEIVHKDLIKPRVVTTLGKVITPIDKSEVFKDMKNKSNAATDENSETVTNRKDKKGKSNDKRTKNFSGNKSGKGLGKSKTRKNTGKKTRK